MVSPLKNYCWIFTPPCPTLALASNIYTLFTSSSSPQVLFFFFSITYHYHLHPNSPHMHAIFSSIYGIRMPSKHSKPTHIHGNTISKFIPQHHHNRNTSKLPCDSYRHFTDFSSREYGPLKNKTYKFTFYTHKQNVPLHYY